LANIYFRRFLEAWKRFGWNRKFRSRIVNYADDFVILTHQCAAPALQTAQRVLEKIGLTLNTVKTRIRRVPEEDFDFLGYTFGRRYSKEGRAYVGVKVSAKKLALHRERLREMTGKGQTYLAAEKLVERIEPVVRGFWNYFSSGSQAQARGRLERYTFDRMESWIKRKHPKGGIGQEKLRAIWPRVEALFRSLGSRTKWNARRGAPVPTESRAQ